MRHQLAEVKLADNFLRLGRARFVSGGAGEVGLAVFVKQLDGLDFLFAENCQRIGGTLEDVLD